MKLGWAPFFEASPLGTWDIFDIKKHTLHDIKIEDGRTVMNITSVENDFKPVSSAIEGTAIAKYFAPRK